MLYQCRFLRHSEHPIVGCLQSQQQLTLVKLLCDTFALLVSMTTAHNMDIGTCCLGHFGAFKYKYYAYGKAELCQKFLFWLNVHFEDIK